jgi:hypothetical protein
MASALRAVEGGLAAEADQVEVPAQSGAPTLAESPGDEHKKLEKVDSDGLGDVENQPDAGNGTEAVQDTGLLTGVKLYAVFGSLMLCVLVRRI